MARRLAKELRRVYTPTFPARGRAVGDVTPATLRQLRQQIFLPAYTPALPAQRSQRRFRLAHAQIVLRLVRQLS